ncbi:MAG TPA: hypothetical protein PKY59_21145 [Pyrinomonadaceae bacterium]|nr:hypothetical protein [Pyrinomonadaceae bacterium]
MHCPNCGQQQVSNEIRFCSRCGFQLGLVAEILANGGTLPQLAALDKNKPRFTKKHGVLLSVFWFMFFVLIMTPFFGIIDVDALAGMSAIVGIFGGFMMLIASLVLLKSGKETVQFSPNQGGFQQLPNAQPNNLYQTNVNALPPQYSQPVSDFAPPSAGSWKSPETGELVQPKSVIEDTTKLLNKDKF